jgi:hypothetical protein
MKIEFMACNLCKNPMTWEDLSNPLMICTIVDPQGKIHMIGDEYIECAVCVIKKQQETKK